MHMSDALVSTAVAAAAGTVSLLLIGAAVRKIRPAAAGRPESAAHDERLVPLMGVTGAFVFAAQMINFSIPGTGSSGHLVGGILLSALLGPWAAFLTLASVLVLQCLVFADGGFMALGANILNMAALSCLVAYPMVFRPLAGPEVPLRRIPAAAIAASIAALELGALAVTLETQASGITALPAGRFLLFMLPIHLVIGIGEGLATASVLCFIRKSKPGLLFDLRSRASAGEHRCGRALVLFALAALLIGGGLSQVASSDPDGLEWSIGRTSEGAGVEAAPDAPHRTAAALQHATALLPDYDTTFAGLVGCGGFLLAAFGVSLLFRRGQRQG